MKVKIIAKAPTPYQYNSLFALRIGFERQLDGSAIGIRHFDTIKEARKHLMEVAYDRIEDTNEYKNAIKMIKKYNCLDYDAVYAKIERV